jgi:hypothetical protein
MLVTKELGSLPPIEVRFARHIVFSRGVNDIVLAAVRPMIFESFDQASRIGTNPVVGLPKEGSI